MGAVADPFIFRPAAETENPALAGLIDEVEGQFATMFVNARNSLRARAAAIDPCLSPIGYKVLAIIWRDGARQQGCVAEEMEVDKALMSRTIKQLEQFGLVVRTIDPSDGRAMLVSMTGQARERFDATVCRARRVLHDRLADWDIDEVRRFTDLMAKLNESPL